MSYDSIIAADYLLLDNLADIIDGLDIIDALETELDSLYLADLATALESV